MKSLFIFLSFITLHSVAFGASKIDSVLLKKIMMMFKADQRWRRELNNLENGKKSAFNEATVNRNMLRTDSLNLIEAKNIVDKHGFPGYSVVGEDGSDGFWSIIQHCDQDVVFQQRVLALMEKEVKKHNATAENFAMLQDRVLISQGRQQLFGTQVRLNLKTHHAQPFPIQDSLNVDSRRKAVGLPPLQDYLKQFDRH